MSRKPRKFPIIGKKTAVLENSQAVVSILNDLEDQGIRDANGIPQAQLDALVGMIQKDIQDSSGKTLTESQIRVIITKLLEEGGVTLDKYEQFLKDVEDIVSASVKRASEELCSKVQEIVDKYAEQLAKDDWIFADVNGTLEDDYERAEEDTPEDLVEAWKEGWEETDQFNILHWNPLFDELYDLVEEYTESSMGETQSPYEFVDNVLYEECNQELIDIRNDLWDKAIEIRGINIYEIAKEVIDKMKKEGSLKKKAYDYPFNRFEVYIMTPDGSKGRWVDLLEVDDDELEEIVNDITNNGAGDYIIADVDVSPDYVNNTYREFASHMTNVFTLKEMIDEIDSMRDAEAIAFLLYKGYDFEEALNYADDVSIYHDSNLGDVAYELYEEGVYGDKCEHLENYIDWDALGRELEISGECREIDGNVYCFWE